MADTCIVCLNDLGGDAVSSPVAAESPPRLDNDNDNDDDPGVNLTPKASLPQQSIENADAPGAIQRLARLVPCLHMFHNECLKPWVERANSCPVCRASFNVVELLDTVGGPVLSTYTVQDRVQVADIDPFMIFEEEVTDDSDTQPCPFCGDNDNEEVLLLCDGCDVPSHTYCLGLDAVPSGSWYCDACETQRAISAVSDAPSRPPRSRRPERRTRAQQRLLRNHNQANSLQWAAVWQSVYDRLNLDLDFPFDDEQQLPRPHGRVTLRRGSHRAWQRRLEVAERQGVGRVFREPSAIIDEYVPRPSRPRVPRAPTPQPESLEEMRAWNAFERARELENDPSAARKRKEPTLSPSPEPTEPERKLKRPRTRRTEELAALATQNSHGEPSRSAARLNADSGGGPSFLQSLLKEVEDASNSPRTDTNGPPTYMNTPNDFHSSPGPSSPSLSPASSSPSSPRLSSRSPPPHSRIRAVSPMQLPPSIDSPSSPPPEFSPSISPAQSQIDNSELRRRPDSRHQDRPGQRRAGSTRSNDVSPSRLSLSLSAKTNIQKLVSSELKPYYRRKVISKDDYTNINRTVSRKLYEHVEEGIELQEDHLRELKDSARKAVKEAVDLIRDKPSSTDEKTDSGNALIGVN